MPILDRLTRLGDVRLVVSTPPKTAGRHRTLRPSPVAQAAAARGLPVITPDRRGLRTLGDTLRELDVAILFVADYGRILPASAVTAVPLAVNVHPSLLPRHRGAAPVVRALWEGDAMTGVTLLGVEEEVDAGPIFDQVAVPILPADDAGSLEGRLAQLAADRVGDLLARVARLPGGPAALPRKPQEGTPTYAPRVTAAEEWLDVTRPADALVRQVRALAPEPGAKLATAEGPLIVLWAEVSPETAEERPGTVGTERVQGRVLPVVRAGDRRGLRLVRVRPAGRRTMDADAFVRGRPSLAGAVWGAQVDRA